MNPCGVICGYIKAPYRSLMRLWADDLGSAIPVQWYHAAPGALTFPFGIAFGSRVWDRKEGGGAQVIGEIPESIRYHSDEGVARGPGRTYCGSQRQWQLGASVSDGIPPINTMTGLPCCCGPAPYVARGGSVSGGTGAFDTNWLLQEAGPRILQEDGSGILWR